MLTTAADGYENTIENPEEQARQQKIYNMEKDCLQNIKDSETNIKQEFTTFRDKEEEIINQYKDTNNLKDALINVLEKSLYDKAREKYSPLTRFGKTSQKTADQTNLDAGKDDLLAMYLDDKSRLTKNLDVNTAKQIRADIKQRIYSRADIIEKRIKEEKQKVPPAHAARSAREEEREAARRRWRRQKRGGRQERGRNHGAAEQREHPGGKSHEVRGCRDGRVPEAAGGAGERRPAGRAETEYVIV